jgi:hypothetical protein
VILEIMDAFPDYELDGLRRATKETRKKLAEVSGFCSQDLHHKVFNFELLVATRNAFD